MSPLEQAAEQPCPYKDCNHRGEKDICQSHYDCNECLDFSKWFDPIWETRAAWISENLRRKERHDCINSQSKSS